ncbi:MAG: ABC transporter ATP-binding protein [Acidobacteriota bacterium]|nr:ABC transporter ATP-binding protein [Acidobacteriota bacterium]
MAHSSSLEPAHADTLIEARGLRFAYEAELWVVDDVSLQIERGALAALIGANGSGKSTLIRLLAGLRTANAGEVLFSGQPLKGIPRQRLARSLAYVPQINPMIFPFTALEVVMTGRSPYTPRFRFESRLDVEKAHKALATVDGAHLAPRPVTELSGGERQLVAVARALAQEPECLILDEPAAALDLKHRTSLIRILRQLRDRQGMTALMVTHDLQLLDPAFDQVFAIHRGALLAEGPPAQVLRDRVLSRVYDDPQVRARKLEGRTFVWSGT